MKIVLKLAPLRQRGETAGVWGKKKLVATRILSNCNQNPKKASPLPVTVGLDSQAAHDFLERGPAQAA